MKKCMKLWSLWPGEGRESAANTLRWRLNKSGKLAWKTSLKSTNQVFNMVSGSSKACFDCLVWCWWLAACGEAHSNPDHSQATTDRTSTHTHSEVPHVEVKYARVLSVCIVCMLLKESERGNEKHKKKVQINTQNGVRWFVCVYSCWCVD